MVKERKTKEQKQNMKKNKDSSRDVGIIHVVIEDAKQS